jgi:hypothetical protein
MLVVGGPDGSRRWKYADLISLNHGSVSRHTSSPATMDIPAGNLAQRLVAVSAAKRRRASSAQRSVLRMTPGTRAALGHTARRPR